MLISSGYRCDESSDKECGKEALTARSGHRHAAVDVDRLAGDVAGFLRREIDAGRADIVAAAHRPHRNARQDGLALLVIERIGHRRGHESGGNRVDGNVAARKLLRDRFGHADQPGLRRDIIRLSRIAGHPDHRGDRDDPPEARLHHRPGRGAHQPERGLEVDPDDLLELLVLHPHQQIVASDAGIVDEDVELAAKRLDRLRHELIDRSAVGQVARQRDMIAAERRAEGFQLVDIAARDREPRALPRQRLGNRAAEPARSAGHQRGHSRKIKHLHPCERCSIPRRVPSGMTRNFDRLDSSSASTSSPLCVGRRCA